MTVRLIVLAACHVLDQTINGDSGDEQDDDDDSYDNERPHKVTE